jgi:hypothetical protein
MKKNESDDLSIFCLFETDKNWNSITVGSSAVNIGCVVFSWKYLQLLGKDWFQSS